MLGSADTYFYCSLIKLPKLVLNSSQAILSSQPANWTYTYWSEKNCSMQMQERCPQCKVLQTTAVSRCRRDARGAMSSTLAMCICGRLVSVVIFWWVCHYSEARFSRMLTGTPSLWSKKPVCTNEGLSLLGVLKLSLVPRPRRAGVQPGHCWNGGCS